MIEIAGAAQRCYEFPAPADEAFAFHRDLARSIAFLPHISIASQTGPDRYRLLYSATEARLYRVRIFCDVLATAHAKARRILIRPLQGTTPVRHEAGLYSMTGYGRYASEIDFRAAGAGTRVTYRLSLAATLPVPLSLRLLPPALLTAAADRVVRRRMEEIVDRFVQGSTAAYTGV